MKKINLLVLSLILSLYSNGQVVGELFSSQCRITKDGHTSVYPMLFRITSESTCELAADVQNSDLIPCILERNMEGEVEIPSKAVYDNGDVTIVLNVTAIGEDAFHLCNQIGSVTIPKGISIIGRDAFMDCSNLEEIICHEGLTSIDEAAFWGCSNLKSITLPTSLETIEDNVFNFCSSLPSITIPAKVIKISDRLFENCTSLESVLIKGKVSTIGVCAFSNCASLKTIDLPSSVTFLGGGVFSECSSLEMLSIPDGVEFLPAFTFQDCISLKKIKLGKNLKEIANLDYNDGNCFIGCTNLEEIFVNCTNLSCGLDKYSVPALTTLHFGDNVEFVGYWSNNPNLKTVTFGKNVSEISNSAFSGCTSLVSVTLPSGITTVSSYAFSGCTSLEKVFIPENVQSIDGSAFSQCESLANITLPKALKIIGPYSFENCSSLKAIDLPTGLTDIGNGAFSGCTCLEAITIPNAVEYLRYNTFSNCFNLKKVKLGKNLKKIDFCSYGDYEDCFKNCAAIEEVMVNSNLPYGLQNSSSLTSLYFGEDVESVGLWPNNPNMKVITLGKNIKTISDGAFYNYTSLDKVISYIDIPFNIDSKVFKYSTGDIEMFSDATLHVPAGSIESYCAADGWKEFIHIKEINSDIFGDANNDYQVNGKDVKTIQDYITQDKIDGFIFDNADVNGDGKVNVADIVKLINIIKN